MKFYFVSYITRSLFPISYLTCCTASTNTDVEYMTYAVVEHGLSCMEYAQCMLREIYCLSFDVGIRQKICSRILCNPA